jgi:hypothetical protein
MPAAAEFHFSDPNYEAQNEALHEHWEQNAQAIAVLQDAGMSNEARQIAIRGLVELSDRAYTMARTLGLHAIADGEMSRVGLSKLMGVHQQTVADWIKRAQAEPERDYVQEPVISRSHLEREAS